MADSNEDWVLYYFSGLAGRGEFMRIIFEEAGVPYKTVGDFAEMKKIREGTLEGIFPCYAPPMIRKGDFNLCQTPIICKYLGKEFGLYPESGADEWHAEQINNTVHDYLAEGRLIFHGKVFSMTYFKQQEETKPYIEWFLAERMEKWLKYFERCLKQNDDGQGFIIGNKLTYVDLGVLHILRATAAQFPEKWEELESIPLLKAFKERIESRPKLAEYFKSERCIPFCGNSMM